MEEKNIDNELFNPEEMQSPFDSIKEVDAEGHEWWNSRKLARLMGYMKYWNFERLMDKVATFLQQEKGLDLKEHMVEIEEMAKLESGTSRQVTSFLLSRTACVAIALNADKKKPITKVAQDYFTQKMDSKELATSFEGNVLIYRTSTGKVNVSVLFNNGTLWLSQRRLSELFAVDVSTINYHLKQLDESGEVHMSDAIRKIPILSDKWDEQGVLLYNLDAIMKMTDWKTLLERYLQISDRDILPDAGSISHEEAEAKALGEYEKFWRLQDKVFLSDFDKFVEGLE